MQRSIKIVLFRTKRFIVGKRARPQSFVGTFHTIYPESYMEYNKWCKVFNISLLHKK